MKIEYKIICKDAIRDLEKEINKLMNEEWFLYGDIKYINRIYMQSMIKHDYSDDNGVMDNLKEE